MRVLTWAKHEVRYEIIQLAHAFLWLHIFTSSNYKQWYIYVWAHQLLNLVMHGHIMYTLIEIRVYYVAHKN